MTGSAPTGIRIPGSLRSLDGKAVVRMEDRVDAAVDDGWLWRSPIPRAWPGGSATWRATCASAASSARASMPAGGKARGAWKRASPHACSLVLTREPDEPEEQAIEVTRTADGYNTILVWEERGMPLAYLAV